MEGNRIVRLSLSSLPTFAGEEAKDDEDTSEFKSQRSVPNQNSEVTVKSCCNLAEGERLS